MNTLDTKISGVITDLGGIKIWHGTWVTKGGGNTAKLMYSLDTLRTRFGVSSAYSYQFMTIIQNGDGNASSVHMQGTTWVGNNCYAVFASSVATTASMRINFITIYSPDGYIHA